MKKFTVLFIIRALYESNSILSLLYSGIHRRRAFAECDPATFIIQQSARSGFYFWCSSRIIRWNETIRNARPTLRISAARNLQRVSPQLHLCSPPARCSARSTCKCSSLLYTPRRYKIDAAAPAKPFPHRASAPNEKEKERRDEVLIRQNGATRGLCFVVIALMIHEYLRVAAESETPRALCVHVFFSVRERKY